MRYIILTIALAGCTAATAQSNRKIADMLRSVCGVAADRIEHAPVNDAATPGDASVDAGEDAYMPRSI